MLKKLTAIFVVYIMIITGSLIKVNAQEDLGFFNYTVENDEVTVTSYYGSMTNITIPNEIDGYKVTKLSGDFLAQKPGPGYYETYTIDSLVLPSSLLEITLPNNEYMGMFNNVNSIEFSENNENFNDEDGCIYNKDKSILYFIPTNLKNLLIPSETKIANLSNMYNYKLEKMVIPETLDKVYMPNWITSDTLKDLEIDFSLTHFSNYLNIYSGSITHIKFGDKINELKNTYIYCDKLEEINYSSNLKSMPSIYSKSLSQLFIPASVDNIDSMHFSALENLENITVDESNQLLKSIDGVLFENDILINYPAKKKEESYTVPEGIKEIRDIHNIYLKQLKLPNTLDIIGINGLSNCINLEKINIPQNVTTLNEDSCFSYALAGCNKIKDITVDENNPVYAVLNNALYSNDYQRLVKWFDRNTKTANISAQTSEVGLSAFEYCDNLENINFNNVTKIMYGAFANCKNISNINLEKVNKIEQYAFLNCISLKKVQFSSDLSEIGLNGFENCINLETINIPQNINDLHEDYYDDYVFKNCNNLKNISIDSNNQKYIVNDNAFYTKDYKMLIKQLDNKINSLSVRDETETIGSMAFSGCNNLKSINTNNVVYIMYGGFSNCNSLTDITLPKVNNLSDSSFAGCNALKAIKLPDSLKTLRSNVFLDCKSLSDVDLNNIVCLNVGAFSGCSNLKTVIIPKVVEQVYGRYNYNLDTGLITKFYVYKDSKALNSILQVNKMDSYEKVNYSIINEFENKDTNIQIETGSTNLDGSSLNVEQITNGADYDEVSKSFENFDLYDIGFYKDNEKVEIDGTAIVKIPVKEGMDENKCKVYYNDNGTYTDMNAVYKDGYMEFKTDHFSQYVLTDNELPTTSLGDVNGDGEINFLDAIMVLRHDAEIIELEENQLKAADVNKDGEVNFLDAIMILRYDAEIIDSF